MNKKGELNMTCSVWACSKCEYTNHILDEFCSKCGTGQFEDNNPPDNRILEKRRKIMDEIKSMSSKNNTLEFQIKANEKTINSLKFELKKVI